MKLVVRALGAFLVSALAVVLVISLISSTLLPQLSDFITDTFPTEKNLEVVSVFAEDPDPAHALPADGDVYETEYYTYTYVSSANGWEAKVKDKNKVHYSSLCETIYGRPVVSLKETYMNCTLLKQAPAIPAGVTDMTSTFSGCSVLEGIVSIYAEPTQYSSCFDKTVEPILLTGGSTMLATLQATASNNNISIE